MTPIEMAQLHKKCFPHAQEWSAATFENYLSKPTTVLTSSNHGFALGQLIAPDCDLLMIAIDPANQNQGLGGDLLGTFFTFIQNKGATRCVIEVDADADYLLRFYEKHQFQTINRLKSYYTRSNGAKTDALVMERQL